MRKNEFLRALKRALRPLNTQDREMSLAYYRELIEDRIEDGHTEQEAVASLEPVNVIAAGILQDASVKGTLRPKRSALTIVLLILGAPLWLSLLVAVFSVLLAIYIVLWSIVLVVASVALSLVVSALLIPFSMIFLPVGGFGAALFFIGCTLVCAALGGLFVLLTILAVKGIASLSKKIAHKTINAVRKRKGNAL